MHASCIPPPPAGPFRIFLPGQWAPGLAVARAFGDFMASCIGVVPTPEFAVFPLTHPPSMVTYGESSSGGFGGSSRNGAFGSGGRSGGGIGSGGRTPPPTTVLVVASDGLFEVRKGAGNGRLLSLCVGWKWGWGGPVVGQGRP